MSLSAILHFGNNTEQRYNSQYKLVDCKYRFSKHFNNRTNRPDRDAKCGVVELTIIAPGKSDLNLYNWYIEREILSGYIEFELPSTEASSSTITKKLVFNDAYCFSLTEHYSILSNSQRVLKLEFVAEKMEIDSVKFTL